MSDEFNKLDAFMRDHRPQSLAGQARHVPRTTQWWIPSTVLAALLVIVLGLSIHNSREASVDNDTIALIEAMDWEAEVEGEMDEISEFVAMVE